ncbi:GntR family transcriptional regulator [Cupriavidus plantarum]|uniref:GntR family transcriptional regulator n=1 Tax=Cupriavidus plantarum TaxID=942865 RepID=UPI000E22B103|nr:GntR family transcriptional regulator [Cupriavidus plantarum]REE93240.1 DNA-binding GntR family transcriptional regulator [Cupriavidus plantarum]
MSKEFVHNSLLDSLREVFIQGDVPPGAKVPEAELCERFGVSRTPLREALKVLAAEGHVELLPNRGARVHVLTLEEVDGLFAVAGALEALAGEQACKRIEPQALAALEAMHEELRTAFRARDLAPYYEANRRIHEAIVAATHNPILQTQYAQLNARIRRIRFASPMTEEIWSRAMAEHEGMLNALQRRDAAAMASILKTHLMHKSEAILDALRAEAAVQKPVRTRRATIGKASPSPEVV